MKTYVLYNKKSDNKAGKNEAEQLREIWKNRQLEFVDAVSLEDYAGFFAALEPDDEVCLCGGDGTLNYFINHVDADSFKNKLYYYPTGSGNDFWNDLGKKKGDAPERINKYITTFFTITIFNKIFTNITNIIIT